MKLLLASVAIALALVFSFSGPPQVEVSPELEYAIRALPSSTRAAITEQVKREQELGQIPPGNEAFILRRLELYRVAIGRSST